MATPLLYCPGLRVGDVPLEAAEARHALLSRRLHPGDAITLFDGRGNLAHTRLPGDGTQSDTPAGGTKRARKRTLPTVVLVERVDSVPAPVRGLTLIVAGCKGARLDWLVEKCTELGVTRLILAEFARSVVRVGTQHVAKLHRTAIEACKQCGRLWLPEVEAGPELPAAIRGTADHALLVAHPSPQATPLGACLREEPASNALIAAVVGPEGGLTPEELELLQATGGKLARLGDHTLRVETAAVAIAAAWAASS